MKWEYEIKRNKVQQFIDCVYFYLLPTFIMWPRTKWNSYLPAYMRISKCHWFYALYVLYIYPSRSWSTYSISFCLQIIIFRPSTQMIYFNWTNIENVFYLWIYLICNSAIFIWGNFSKCLLDLYSRQREQVYVYCIYIYIYMCYNRSSNVIKSANII